MKNWFKVFFLFFILGLLVYFNSLNNKFLIDDYVFVGNPVLSNTKFIFSQWNPFREQALGVMDAQGMQGVYRPMAFMLYDLCYTVFKNNFWQYHLFNLFLFVLASSLIYLLINRITGNYNLAFLVGLFFLIHPINGIVVNYIVSSIIALLLIFMMGTILLLWESLERKNNRTLYFLSLLFSFLSLFWHEIGMMIPFYVSTVILLFRKDPYKAKIIYLFPYFLIVFSCLLFRSFFVSSDFILKHTAILHMTGWEYLATVSRLLIWYVIRLFYPQGIVMQWVTPIFHEHIFWDNLDIILLLILFILSFVRFAQERICRLAIAWILIGFVPVCAVAFTSPDVCAFIEPHWFIFSSIGFFILVAYFCLILLGRMKKAAFVLLFILIFTWGLVSHAYNRLWADQKTYALYWSQQVPILKSTYFFLAKAYQDEGVLKEARKYYRIALSGHSFDKYIYINLEAIDLTDGHTKDAELDCKMALKIDPHSAVTYYNLGSIYYAEGQLGKAEENFNRSLMLNPFLINSRRGLASIFLKRSEYQKAINLCLKNLDIVNDDTRTLSLLIDIFIREKDFVNLKKYTQRFINSETDPKILTNLGVVMAQHNAPDLALDCFTKVIRAYPGYKDAYLATGTLFANLGKYEEAIHIWQIGSRIDPFDNRFKKSIIKAVKLEKST